MSAAVSVFPEQPISPSPRAGAPYDQKAISVASSGDQALVVWSDRRRGASALGGVPYIAYMRVDAASGSVRRVFYRSIGETRVRSARH